MMPSAAPAREMADIVCPYASVDDSYRLPSRGWAYLIAAIIGVAAAVSVMPLSAITGSGPGWHPPFPDQAQALAAHLAFQADRWRWPLMDIGTLFWPHGISGALVDFNPLLSILAKLWTKTSGGAPVNLFGIWMASCLLLQPIAAVYAARGLRVRLPGAIAAAVMAASWPALLERMGHLNLCAHFLLLVSLGLVFRRMERAGGWAAPAIVMTFAALVHPYLFQLCAVLFATLPLHALLTRRPTWLRDALAYAVSGALAVGVFMVLSFVTGGKDSGFVFFSMNVLSPIWPQRSGVFGADLPIIDATGGQYEGFNWLGAGVMLLVVIALVRAAISGRSAARSWRRRYLSLAIILVGLTLLSLSSRVYAGHVMILDLGAQPWESLFGTFRAPGRAFWPVGYAIMLFAVAAAGRLPRTISVVLLLVAGGLQVIDAGPLRTDERAKWAQGDRIPVPPIPLGTTLFTAAPFSGCTSDSVIMGEEPLMLLAAVRGGARTGEIGLGRPPRWFNCARVASDTLELPLASGESRAFLGQEAQSQLRPRLLGPDAACRQVMNAILCGRGVTLPEGGAVSAGAKLAELAPGDKLLGPSLASALGVGWRVVPPAGDIWSEGARNTMVMAVPSGHDFLLTIEAVGVARPAGGKRFLRVFIGRDEAGVFTLIDGQPAMLSVPVPAARVADGILRVAIDIDGDIDPKKYGFTAPVARAGFVLRSVALAAQ